MIENLSARETLGCTPIFVFKINTKVEALCPSCVQDYSLGTLYYCRHHVIYCFVTQLAIGGRFT